jgi:hypothetical protein
MGIPKILKTKTAKIIALVLIIIGAFVVRLYKINEPLADWHSWRQSDTASVTRTYVEQGIDLLNPRYQDISSIQTGMQNPKGLRLVELPIYNVIHAIFTINFPQYSLEFWGRMTSILFSLLSIVFLYLLSERYIGKYAGLLSAFFFAFIPFNIFFSRVILPEPTAVALSLGALWFFSQFIEKDKQAYLYISGLFFCLAMLVKPFAIFYAVPMIWLIRNKWGDLITVFKNSKLLIKFLIFVNIILVPLLLWRYRLSLNPEGVPFFTWAFNGDHIRFRPAFWRWIFAERLGKMILGIWGLIPFIFSILDKGKNGFTRYFLLGGFLYVSTIATANVRHDYYQTFIIPMVVFGVSAGAYYLWNQQIFNKVIARTLLVFSIFMMLMVGYFQIKDFYNINHPEIIKVGAIVDKITPKDALVVAPYNGDTAFLYQTKRWGWPAIDSSIDDIIARGADYYVSLNYDDDTNKFMKRFVAIEKTPEYIILDLHKEIGK